MKCLSIEYIVVEMYTPSSTNGEKLKSSVNLIELFENQAHYPLMSGISSYLINNSAHAKTIPIITQGKFSNSMPHINLDLFQHWSQDICDILF